MRVLLQRGANPSRTKRAWLIGRTNAAYAAVAALPMGRKAKPKGRDRNHPGTEQNYSEAQETSGGVPEGGARTTASGARLSKAQRASPGGQRNGGTPGAEVRYNVDERI